MRMCTRRFIGVLVAAGGMFAALASASAETCTLELKRLESATSSRADYIYRSTSSQGFFMQVGENGRSRLDGRAAAFAEIVSKEPEKYESEYPFRGVAKLGSQQFAFVLDAAPAEPDSAESKPESTEPEPESVAPDSEPPPKVVKPIAYSRLYFDLNHNGDLTDDEVVEANPPQGRSSSNYSQHMFPRVDVTIEADGTKMDYAFFFSVYSHSSTVLVSSSGGKESRSRTMQYASAGITAAAYREGQITLGGKQRRVVLIDFNSNGRFDDESAVRDDVRTPDGQVHYSYGDRLWVDPDTDNQSYRSTYDVTTSDDQHLVSKLVNIDDSFYDVEVTAAGDKLTLTPSSVPTGYVTNPNEGLSALVYSEKGLLKISGGKLKRAPLPEGDWKLLSYTIDQTGYRPEPPTEENETKKEERSLLRTLAEALVGGAEKIAPRPPSRPRYTVVSARATNASKSVTVRQGESTEMLFGPPYRPVVKVASRPRSGSDKVQLELSLIGSDGEVCSNLTVNGQRPGKPEFTITTLEGEEVASGSFEYG